jgi:hypothetical protein
MGFIVPDVAKTLEEEQKEEALKMGKTETKKLGAPVSTYTV